MTVSEEEMDKIKIDFFLQIVWKSGYTREEEEEEKHIVVVRMDTIKPISFDKSSNVECHM